MKGLDTNLLVRILLQDDPVQAPLAAAWLRRECAGDASCLVNHVVLCELAWVLTGSYGLARGQVAQALENLLLSRNLVVDEAEAVWEALEAYRGGGAGFAECLIGAVNRRRGCTTTATFDQKAGSLGDFTLVA